MLVETDQARMEWCSGLLLLLLLGSLGLFIFGGDGDGVALERVGFVVRWCWEI
jgi:hypothetical protein